MNTSEEAEYKSRIQMLESRINDLKHYIDELETMLTRYEEKFGDLP